MIKTLFTAALALVLMIGGFALSAADESSSAVANLIAKIDVDLKDNLINSTPEGKSFGYFLSNGEFTSLATALDAATPSKESGKATFSLGSFSSDQSIIAFGYGSGKNETGFTGVSVEVVSDPLYYSGYDADGFYHLDFSEDPFDGTIEVLVLGEPLPSSTVTLLVGLAAVAAFLLYNNRKRMRSLEQA